MQIKELVLYGKNGNVRTVKFNLGKVNIIIGESGTGKSAIGDIIDYCLASKECNIAEGVIRENVEWYGLMLQFEDEMIFIARRNPTMKKNSTSEFYIEIGKKLEPPSDCEFKANNNKDGIKRILSARLGISENLNIPPAEQTRNPLEANIRHANYYCFQNQDEIAANKFLFHSQYNSFITQSIKDTLPYFLGIINEDAIALEDERKKINKKLNKIKRRIEYNKEIEGKGAERAIALVSEAKVVGLISNNIDVNNSVDAHKMLSKINEEIPTLDSNTGLDELINLQDLLRLKKNNVSEINLKINNAINFANEKGEYSDEVKHQKNRLESIGLFKKINFEPGLCPLCSSKMQNSLPEINMMQNAIISLNERINMVSLEKPKLRKYIVETEKQKEVLENEIIVIKAKIEGIYKQNKEAERIKELNSRQAKVLGRISLWLESVEENKKSYDEENMKRFETRIKEIDGLLDKDEIEVKKEHALSRISFDMSKWAKELELEHSDSPYRLDLKKATVMVDRKERSVPLSELGSGSNWVRVHLITYFALQKFFINANRPVPRFLFLDQFSQVFYSSESGKNKIDHVMVKKLYKFIIERVNELNGKLQVIIVEHAEANDQEEIKKLVIEEWLGEKKLVPADWY